MAWEWFILVAIAVLMIVGATIDGWKLKVPNRLTFFMILTGWLAWASQGWSELGYSVLGALAAGGLLVAPYAVGAMGAGDVKLYAGFGAWMVPIPWFGMQNLLWAFAVSAMVGAAMAGVLIWWNKSFFTNLDNVRAIAQDWRTSASIGEISQKAKARKPSLLLLPYGIPLTIGSLLWIAYLVPGTGLVQ